MQELTDFPAAQATSVATPPGGVYAFESPAAAPKPDAEGSVRSSAHATVSLQTSGTLLYTPASASSLDGTDFSTFIANAQKNSAVSGDSPLLSSSHRSFRRTPTPHDVHS